MVEDIRSGPVGKTVFRSPRCTVTICCQTQGQYMDCWEQFLCLPLENPALQAQSIVERIEHEASTSEWKTAYHGILFKANIPRDAGEGGMLRRLSPGSPPRRPFVSAGM